jgi:hypothetical protein
MAGNTDGDDAQTQMKEAETTTLVDEASDAKDPVVEYEVAEISEEKVRADSDDSMATESSADDANADSTAADAEDVDEQRRNMLEAKSSHEVETDSDGENSNEEDTSKDAQDLGDSISHTTTSSRYSSIKTGLDYVSTALKPPLMVVIRFLSTIMDAMLQRAWGTRYGNQLTSFIERSEKTMTSVASRIDDLAGTNISTNSDLISFGVNATILGPPIVLTLILMRLVSSLLSGGRKKPSTHGKWKGAPPPSTTRLDSTQQDVPGGNYNQQVGMAPPPPMMMAPPAGGLGSGIPSPATSPRDTPPYPTPFSNPYAVHSGGQQPPHLSSDLPPGPPHVNTGAQNVLSNASNVDMSRTLSLTEPMEPIDMSNDIPDSEGELPGVGHHLQGAVIRDAARLAVADEVRRHLAAGEVHRHRLWRSHSCLVL